MSCIVRFCALFFLYCFTNCNQFDNTQLEKKASILLLLFASEMHRLLSYCICYGFLCCLFLSLSLALYAYIYYIVRSSDLFCCDIVGGRWIGAYTVAEATTKPTPATSTAATAVTAAAATVRMRSTQTARSQHTSHIQFTYTDRWFF